MWRQGMLCWGWEWEFKASRLLSQLSLEGQYIHNNFKWTKGNHKAMTKSKSVGYQFRIMYTGDGFKLNLRSKGLFAIWHLLFHVFIVLLRYKCITAVLENHSRGRISHVTFCNIPLRLSKRTKQRRTSKWHQKQMRCSSFDALSEQSVHHCKGNRPLTPLL